ncbi:MAG TPA: arginine--tRNA ligase [Hyphomicrobiaceae bacterium]|nr:arginine--tRNA ligase [Hyphomicrobiaceae bacterium]
MNVYSHLERAILSAVDGMKARGELPNELVASAGDIDPPRDPSHGDLASNVAMVLAKAAKKKPRDIAEAIARQLAADPLIAKADVAGPGFLNIKLKPAAWHGVVQTAVKAGPDYGRSDLGRGSAVNVEYVSANPTGPMHVGHCRGAVYGDVLASLLAFAGYKVTREYYINDAGAQVGKLAQSTLLRYREALGEAIGEIPEGLYPGDYLKPVGAALAARFGRKLLEKPLPEQLAEARAAAVSTMMAEIKDDLAALAVRHDVFFSERSLTNGNRDKVADAIDLLREKGLIYQGRLEKPKGHDADDWEDREQTLFRSTSFGDDVDRALIKSDGGYTYFASDIAYHFDKLERGFPRLINVFGADHSGYLKRMHATVDALSGGKADFDIKVCQLVRVFRNGEPVKMSKRAGTFVALRDVVDEVGRDPVRFMMLYRKAEAALDFDLAKVIEQSKDNPVFYVQYAHARIHSVLRNAKEAFPDLDADGAEIAGADLSGLTDAAELDLIKLIAGYPKLIEGAARAAEPHRLAFYLYDLASAFHSLWNRGLDSPHLRLIHSHDRSSTAARIAMIQATRHVIASGLGILGVQAPSEMR